jgi:hypothetical protein
MILNWYAEDRTGTLFADLLEDASMCILNLNIVSGQQGYELLDPDHQVIGRFATADEAKDAAVGAAERWFDS